MYRHKLQDDELIRQARQILSHGPARNINWPACIVHSYDKALEARAWSIELFGVPNLTTSIWRVTGKVFFFKNPEDLLIFKLKWE